MALQKGEGLQVRLNEEELWLRQLQEELGGLEYIQTLGGKAAETLVALVAFLEERRDGAITPLERFTLLNRLIQTYISDIPGEADRLQRFWAGLVLGLIFEGVIDPEERILADPNTSEFSDGIETEVLMYKILVERGEREGLCKSTLKEKMDKLSRSSEVQLQRFALGLKQGLVTKGLV